MWHQSLEVRLGIERDQCDADAKRSQSGRCEETDDGPTDSAAASSRCDPAADNGANDTLNHQKTEQEENDWAYIHPSDA